MRKILRRIAHAKMRKARIKRANKRNPVDGKSYFSRCWRDWA